MTMRLGSTIAILAAVLCVAASTGAASMRVTTVARGGTLHFKAAGDWTSVCTAILKYSSGEQQVAGTRHATNGWMKWAVPITRDRPLGRGKWSVYCGLRLAKAGSFVVVNSASAG